MTVDRQLQSGVYHIIKIDLLVSYPKSTGFSNSHILSNNAIETSIFDSLLIRCMKNLFELPTLSDSDPIMYINLLSKIEVIVISC